MKLLLLFTLLSFACYGQTDRNPNDFYSDSVPNVIGYWKARDIPVVKVKELSLEEKLLLYAQECWEDSSLQEFIYTNGKWEKMLSEWQPIPPPPYKKVWVHRKPTLEGFIEWLGKQK